VVFSRAAQVMRGVTHRCGLSVGRHGWLRRAGLAVAFATVTGA